MQCAHDAFLHYTWYGNGLQGGAEKIGRGPLWGDKFRFCGCTEARIGASVAEPLLPSSRKRDATSLQEGGLASAPTPSPPAAAPKPEREPVRRFCEDCFRVHAEFKAILSSQSRHPMQPPSNTSQAVLSRDIPPHTVEKCRKMQLYYRCGIPKLKQKSHEIDLSSTNFWLSAHGTIYAAMRIFYSASGVVDIGFLHAGPLNCQNRKTAWTKLADILPESAILLILLFRFKNGRRIPIRYHRFLEPARSFPGRLF